MDVERYLLSSSLKGIISQTLAKKLCPSCRIQRPANDTEKILFKKTLGVDIETIYEAGRCDNCHNGYTGRIALQEVLMINDEIREAINKNIDREELRHLIYKKGVKTLFQDGLIKVMEGITDLKEVFRLVDYDDYDDVSEEIVEQNIGIKPIENNDNDNIVYNSLETAPKSNDNIVYNSLESAPKSNDNIVYNSLETAPKTNEVIPTNTNIDTNNTTSNNYINVTPQSNQAKESIVNIPNYNTDNTTSNNQIITPKENNNSIFENNNPNNNLFDDNVFNALRINNTNNTNQNNFNNNYNTSYTDDLLNMINNDTSIGA